MRLIAGGSGFLGIELARQLSAEGTAVRVFDSVTNPWLPDGVDFVRGDVRDPAAVSRACRGARIVYHLVGVVPQARVAPPEMRSVNVGGTRNVIDACVSSGVERLVFVSSSEIYGHLERVPCPESAIPAPIGEYGVNKVAAELLCREAMHRHGLAVSVLRPTTIVGQWNWDSAFATLFKQLDSDGFLPVPGRGEARWHVVHVEDAASAVILAGDSGEAVGEAFNVASRGRVPTHLELAQAMKAHSGSGARVVKVNTAVATGVLRALCAVGLSPMEPDQFLVGFSDYVLDVGKARELLGWESRYDSLGAFKASYDWYEERHDPRMCGAGR